MKRSIVSLFLIIFITTSVLAFKGIVYVKNGDSNTPLSGVNISDGQNVVKQI